MCTQYYVDQNNQEIRKILDALNHDERIKMGKVSPTDVVPVLTAQREPQIMQWGFNCCSKERIFNIPSETVMENPLFQKTIRENRCLVPISWYFEWNDIGTASRQKHSIGLPGENILYAAGFYRLENEMDLPAFVFLTCQASPSISGINHRMPIIFHRVLKPLWLHGPNPQRLFDFAEQNMRSKLAM